MKALSLKLISALILALFISCDKDVSGSSEAEQFYMPEFPVTPESYWVCTRYNTSGPEYQLLCESLAGLVNGALAEGRTDKGLWIDTGQESYENCKAHLGRRIKSDDAYALLSEIKDEEKIVKGYILTDIGSNPESAIATSAAAHISQGVIVDVKDEERVRNIGCTLLYDAREKTTQDAWDEFHDRCRNNALVVMPVGTAQLRNFSICNHLFVININKKRGTTSGGMNSTLFNEVLSWLSPASPVLGWESGEFGEDEFVGKVSSYGHLMLAADWSYNHPLTSARSRSRQSTVQAPSEELKSLEKEKENDNEHKMNYISFFLSDGDNYQWTMSDGFKKNFYQQPESRAVKMGYGLACQAMAELAPARYDELLTAAGSENTIMETFGGGYFYADSFGEKTGQRKELLKTIAGRTAAHMQAHGIKVLQLTAWDVLSQEAKEAYQAFVDANPRLEGIVVIQYSPYTGGNGKILWCRNTEGKDIPVLTVKYDLWKGQTREENGGDPQELARLIEEKEQSGEETYSAVCVHAWSEFSGKKSAAAAKECADLLPERFKVVSMQELLWRITKSHI
ncbi:MAG: hypothetical protein K5984_01165 [Bacteroidales bacterium]|nr:hypothetical protein [Bacteroidales bacterium]